MPNGNGHRDSGRGTDPDERRAVERVKDRVIRALKMYVGEEPELLDTAKVEKLSCRQKYRARDLEPPPPKLRSKP